MYLSLSQPGIIQAGDQMFKINHENTRTRCEICSTLTIKITERRQRRRSTYFTSFSIFIVNFEQVNADWDMKLLHIRRRADSNAELSFLRVSFYFIFSL